MRFWIRELPFRRRRGHWLLMLLLLLVCTAIYVLLYSNAYLQLSRTATFQSPRHGSSSASLLYRKTDLKERGIAMEVDVARNDTTVDTPIPNTDNILHLSANASKTPRTPEAETVSSTRTIHTSTHTLSSPGTAHQSVCGEMKFQTSNSYLNRFRPALKDQELRMLLETVDAFTSSLELNNIPYFMYGGTLLGSWRHLGFVPWDDDVDFAVPIAHRQKIYRILRDLRPGFILDVRQKVRWKFYHNNSYPIKRVSWKFPFLDISFYEQNSNLVWDHDTNGFAMYKYPKDWIFPLRRRPFCGRMLWSPGKPEKTLRLTYLLEQCKIGSFNHRTETFNSKQSTVMVGCWKLRRLLPFVKRSPVKDGCNETLEQEGQVLSYFIDSSLC